MDVGGAMDPELIRAAIGELQDGDEGLCRFIGHILDHQPQAVQDE